LALHDACFYPKSEGDMTVWQVALNPCANLIDDIPIAQIDGPHAFQTPSTFLPLTVGGGSEKWFSPTLGPPNVVPPHYFRPPLSNLLTSYPPCLFEISLNPEVKDRSSTTSIKSVGSSRIQTKFIYKLQHSSHLVVCFIVIASKVYF
jgi:hypothetical protein